MSVQTIESIKRRIDNAKDLLSIVKTMKALAAVNIRQFERAMESLGNYYRAIEMGFLVVLRDPAVQLIAPKAVHTSRMGAIVLGSDQGMCGQFNEQIASFSIAQMNRLAIRKENCMVLALGVRLISRLEELNQPIEDAMPISGSIAGIAPMVQEILMRVDKWRSDRAIDQVFLFCNRPTSVATYQPHVVRLLPVDPDQFRNLANEKWPSRVLPMFTMDGRQLLSALIRQYLFITLFRAFAESLASENTSRLATMQSAERSISEHLENLDAQFHQQRQSAITEELLDIVSGFEALR
jgi:F-type H+-transporting ATPase subunit gamma